MNNHSIITYTGECVDLLNPKPENVCVIDIAHHLAMLVRFTGAVQYFYSVAQHSVLVSQVCDPEYALEGLFHDAPEAYLADISAPLKHSFAMEHYRALEKLHHGVIRTALGLKEDHPSIKVADEAVYHVERRTLLARHPEFKKWYVETEPATGIEILPTWSPAEGERKFLARYYEILDSTRQRNSGTGSQAVHK